MKYRHTQTGWVIIASLGAELAFALLAFAGAGPLQPAAGSAALILLAAMGLFYSLTVEVGEGTIRCRFGPGVIRRSIAISEIADARCVRNPWYSGWGIRWRPGAYLLWNVSGYDAVELILTNGNRFRIGTDEPEALLRAILSHRTNRTTTKGLTI